MRIINIRKFNITKHLINNAMKKYLILSAALFAVIACEKDKAPSYPVPEAGTSYVLEGTVNRRIHVEDQLCGRIVFRSV